MVAEYVQALGYLADPVYWVVVLGALFFVAFLSIAPVPGLSSTILAAISLPFIIDSFTGERQAIGLAMVVVLAGVGNTSRSSVEAILLGLPSAGSYVTFLEGHQLARQGKAAHTLGAVYAASAVGGVVGVLILLLLLPILKPFFALFGFQEFATVIGALLVVAFIFASKGAVVKGFMAGGLGLLLSTVGPQRLSPDLRFTLGQPGLMEGLPVIVALLGILALPEIIDLSVARRPVALGDAVITTREALQGGRYALGRWRMLVRQSALGAVLYVAPGVGAGVTGWMAYVFGILWSRDKSRFGKGSLEGMLFVESARHSESTRFAPAVALGLPSGIGPAFVLVVMILMGIQPGPSLLEDHADIVVLIGITLGIGALAVAALGIVTAGYIGRLTRVPYPLLGGILIPLLLLNAVISVDATASGWLLLLLLFLFTGVGIAMKLLGWPRLPLLLGLILGSSLEDNLTLAYQVYGLTQMVNWPLFIILLLVPAVIYAFARRGWGLGRPEDTAAASEQPPDMPLLQKVLQLRNLPVVLVLICALAFLFGALDLSSGSAKALPLTVSIVVIALAVTQFALHLRGPVQTNTRILDLGMHSLALPGARRALGLIAAGLLIVVLLGSVIGFPWAVIALAGYLPYTLFSRSDITAPSSVDTASTGGVPAYPGLMGVVALGFVVSAAIAVVMTGAGHTTTPYLAALGVLTLTLLSVRQVREFRPSPGMEWLFSWRLLSSIVAMSFIYLFYYGVYSTLPVVWPDPVLLDWVFGSGA